MKKIIALSLFSTLLVPIFAMASDYPLMGTYTCSADGYQCWNPDEAGKQGVVLYETSDPWQFWLDPGEKIQLKIVCTADHIKNVHFDKNSHIDCDKHKDDKRHWHFDCRNKSDDSHHHLYVKSFHCGPNTTSGGCGGGDCGGGDYDDPAENGE